MREVLSGPLGPGYLEQRASEGWKPVAVVWERELAASAPDSASVTEEVPYGLKISEDCSQLEEDAAEREALVVMLELIVQDKPLSQVAEELNRRGLRTRHKTKWTPGTVFDMLPRLIDVGPRVFTSEEWVVRRAQLFKVI